MCLKKKRKQDAAISDLQMELKSSKRQSTTRLTQIENRFKNRLNQIEDRFAYLEGLNSREVHDNDDDWYITGDSGFPDQYNSQDY